MATKRPSAIDVAKWRSSVDVWIDHADIFSDDVARFEAVEKLTLWNVAYPVDLFARMPRLWWLDVRGGTVKNFQSLATAQGLRYLCINQIRGLEDLSDISSLKKLEYLSLYGLSKVETLPELSDLSSLRRVEVGQMKGLQSLDPIWKAQQLEEIQLMKEVPAGPDDLKPINNMPNLKAFSWVAIDVPAKRSRAINEGVSVPKARSLHATDWFEEKDQ
ncbi:leucine-rich repeat domain-containing protein [Cognatiyoonia sp. IB215182]|uniref:leucine-rich repeat domain-containing protein n=1 Tax=Cognatiyoonia sp. IB215182 TaxID=3097353 RepID=UPI002A166E05|nr:leucine-rich repeat domain-containing protein [Cognatiyoonia sp. IB215182]MDX8354346.1 leucine-rich repeat domain-containing protein [Cognatiyoonia sp. IB215182]